jgi:hypothetical protein
MGHFVCWLKTLYKRARKRSREAIEEAIAR